MEVTWMGSLDVKNGLHRGRLEPRELLEGRKSSRPSASNQKPCAEILVISVSEVLDPGISDLLLSTRSTTSAITSSTLSGTSTRSRLELRLAGGARDHPLDCRQELSGALDVALRLLGTGSHSGVIATLSGNLGMLGQGE